MSILTFISRVAAGFKEHGGGSHGAQGSSYVEEGDGSSRLVTEGTQDESDGVYKPSLHDGKKKDGSDDSRVSSEHGFGMSSPLCVQKGSS